jgi:UPF0271 protein
MGDDEILLGVVSSANVACGFPTSDSAIMHRTVQLAVSHGVAIGDHISLPDPQGFGRRHLADGSLQSRREPDAVIEDASMVRAQAISIARDEVVQAANGRQINLNADTRCLHGDGTQAVALAQQLREALEHAALRIAASGAA